MSAFVTHLESTVDGTRLPCDRLQGTYRDRPLWVRYDLPAIGRAVTREDLLQRPPSLWRYRELLPVVHDENVVSLGEGMSPLVECPRLGAELGLDHLLIKDESQLPTGSFKARGLAMAVSRAKELGARRLAIPTAGNAGGALAAYASRAGLEAYVFMPADTPLVNRIEAAHGGAKVFLVDGLINDCGAIVCAGADRMEWFNCATLREPYRVEGKKTMGIELAEQLGWRLPDVILCPTGGGSGMIGMWKAFAELGELGWLEDAGRPRMYACQSEGCAPIVRAFERGERYAEPFEGADTVASGLRVPEAVGDFLILDAIRASGGQARAAPEGELVEWMRRAVRTEGISLCPEAAACVCALDRLVAEGQVRRDETVVVFNTGAAQKYVEVLGSELPRISPNGNVDWDRIEAS